jgi:hypothetical protein
MWAMLANHLLKTTNAPDLLMSQRLIRLGLPEQQGWSRVSSTRPDARAAVLVY